MQLASDPPTDIQLGLPQKFKKIQNTISKRIHVDDNHTPSVPFF